MAELEPLGTHFTYYLDWPSSCFVFVFLVIKGKSEPVWVVCLWIKWGWFLRVSNVLMMCVCSCGVGGRTAGQTATLWHRRTGQSFVQTHTLTQAVRVAAFPVVFTSVSNNDSVDVKNRSRSSYWVLKHRVCGINTVAKHAQNNFIHHTK